MWMLGKLWHLLLRQQTDRLKYPETQLIRGSTNRLVPVVEGV